MTQFNTCLNQELKIYGVSLVALLVSAAFFIIGAIIFSLMIGISFGGVGFVLGIWLSRNWHSGKIQKFLYWHFSVGFLLGSKVIASCKRYFF